MDEIKTAQQDAMAFAEKADAVVKTWRANGWVIVIALLTSNMIGVLLGI